MTARHPEQLQDNTDFRTQCCYGLSFEPTKEQMALFLNELSPLLRRYNLPIDQFEQSQIYCLDHFMAASTDALSLDIQQQKSFVHMQKKIAHDLEQYLKKMNLAHLSDICKHKGIWTSDKLLCHARELNNRPFLILNLTSYERMRITTHERMRVICNKNICGLSVKNIFYMVIIFLLILMIR
tara:strand:- start:929 stop:1474 length:546 start_codon:yes stop_codon:yes gene_type:complete